MRRKMVSRAGARIGVGWEGSLSLKGMMPAPSSNFVSSVRLRGLSVSASGALTFRASQFCLLSVDFLGVPVLVPENINDSGKPAGLLNHRTT